MAIAVLGEPVSGDLLQKLGHRHALASGFAL
jgi:hypothetical protein